MSWDDWYWEYRRLQDWWDEERRRQEDDWWWEHRSSLQDWWDDLMDPANPIGFTNPTSPNYLFRDTNQMNNTGWANYELNEEGGEGQASIIGALIVFLLFGLLLWIMGDHVKLLESWSFIVKEIAKLLGFN